MKENRADICFVIDTTGSMGDFINEAKRRLVDAVSTLSAQNNIDLEIGLVEYRDHPREDTSFITRVYPLTNNFKQIQKSINKLAANGGGDYPEAVYDGIQDACTQMKWRAHSCRYILLVGDAPPHGYQTLMQEREGTRGRNMGDRWANGYPNGLSLHTVTATAETHQVTIHSLCVNNDATARSAFSAISRGTGGQCSPSNNSANVTLSIIEVLKTEFQNLDFERSVLNTIEQLHDRDLDRVAKTLNCNRLKIAASIARLGKRGLIET